MTPWEQRTLKVAEGDNHYRRKLKSALSRCRPTIPRQYHAEFHWLSEPEHTLPSSFWATRRRNMRSLLYNMRSLLYVAIAIATPAMAQTTTPTSNTMSTQGSNAGMSTPTLSHDGSASLTNSNASSARNSPGAGASPHTGFSSGMTPSAGTASGTADGTTDTGATSPGSGKSAAQR
jgi:hypothetical protein